MKTDYAGIDYSRGLANKDNVTGIRYGVIPLHAVDGTMIDYFDAVYGDPCCPECGNLVIDSKDGCGYYCETCKDKVPFDYAIPEDPTHWELNNHEYLARFGDDNDIFIIKSEYYTYAQFCSPCAPGAGYLLNPCVNGPKTYCFHHSWFENNIAPYPVYSVATNELIQHKE